MQGLEFLHLRDTLQKLVRQHTKRTSLLTEEIWKAEKLMDRENLTQNRRDDRRDVERKNEIFENGIKGIKKITVKYNTSKPLTELKISCPCGLKWGWQDSGPPPEAHTARERRIRARIKVCTVKLQSHSSKLTYDGVEVRLKSLAEMTLLIQATQPHPHPTHRTSKHAPSCMIMDPADDHNQLVGIETFIQRNANHSYATRGNTECGKTGPETMSRITMSPAQGQPSQIRSIDHFCAAKDCFRMDPTHFCSTRHLTKDKTFLDRAGIFDFQTTSKGETIREPVNTFREFSMF